ncbi:hypothetical protein Q7P35_010857 [Cladosporium inversicolor]
MALDAKTEVMQQVRQQAALQNARFLVDKVNEHCFERAIPNPGSSISSSEQTAFTNCMEKYMAAWNTTSRQYLGHLQKGAGAGGM